MTEEEIDKIANACRTNFGDWIDTACSSGRRSAVSWMEDMKNTYIRIRLNCLEKDRLLWREALELAILQMEPKWPDVNIRAIMKNKCLEKNKSPDSWLTAKAYMWLLYLETNPPKKSSWFPAFAVKVAHKAFRLPGALKSFIKYLTLPARRKKLASLAIPRCGHCGPNYNPNPNCP